MDEHVTVRPTVRVGRWTVRGSSKVLGDAEFVDGDVHGLASIKGKLIATRLSVEGTLEVGGDCHVQEQLTLKGTGRFDGAVHGVEVSLDGTSEVRGGVVVRGTLSVTGKLGSAGSVSAATLQFRGRVDAAGDWAAHVIDGRLDGESRARNLRARAVRLRRDGAWRKGQVSVGRVEATEVYLEHAEVEYLRAERIELGPDCHVAQLDGEVVRQHRTAVVGFEVRSHPPRWLTR